MRNSFTALAALLLASSAAPALADTLITNANGIQVDANGRLEHFTGILIGDDGKVKRLLHGEMRVQERPLSATRLPRPSSPETEHRENQVERDRIRHIGV